MSSSINGGNYYFIIMVFIILTCLPDLLKNMHSAAIKTMPSAVIENIMQAPKNQIFF
jgi:hypothetical protein